MRPVAVYSALRLGMFLAVFLVLRLIGVGGLLSLVLALVISMLLSFVLLRAQRDEVTRALIGSQERRREEKAKRRDQPRRSLSERIAADAEAEDALLDQQQRGPRPDDHRTTGRDGA